MAGLLAAVAGPFALIAVSVEAIHGLPTGNGHIRRGSYAASATWWTEQSEVARQCA